MRANSPSWAGTRHKHINAIKKKGTPISSIGTMAGGVMAVNVCPHCTVVRRSAPHKKNACYFNPNNMTDRMGWARKLMDEKVVACNDDE